LQNQDQKYYTGGSHHSKKERGEVGVQKPTRGHNKERVHTPSVGVRNRGESQTSSKKKKRPTRTIRGGGLKKGKEKCQKHNEENRTNIQCYEQKSMKLWRGAGWGGGGSMGGGC